MQLPFRVGLHLSGTTQKPSVMPEGRSCSRCLNIRCPHAMGPCKCSLDEEILGGSATKPPQQLRAAPSGQGLRLEPSNLGYQRVHNPNRVWTTIGYPHGPTVPFTCDRQLKHTCAYGLEQARLALRLRTNSPPEHTDDSIRFSDAIFNRNWQEHFKTEAGLKRREAYSLSHQGVVTVHGFSAKGCIMDTYATIQFQRRHLASDVARHGTVFITDLIAHQCKGCGETERELEWLRC